MKYFAFLTAIAFFAPAVGGSETEDARSLFRAWKILDASSQGPEDDPDILWALKHSRMGTHTTPDGRLWAYVDPPGGRDDYSVLIEDIRKGNGSTVTAWVRGNHKNDPTVKYRTSMGRYLFDCQGSQIQTLYRVTYAADGSVVSSWEGISPSYGYKTVVPGSIGESWLRLACSKP